MPSELGTELRGRSWSLEVLPFSFREYLAAKGLRPDDKGAVYGPKKALTKRLFLDFLRWGGFPEACVLDSEVERTKLLREYMGAMFFRDLVERYGITNIPLLDALSDKLFSSFSQKLSLTAVYRQYKDRLPLSKDLLFRYHKHFLESMLIYQVPILTESAYARMRNPARVYLADNGLARRTACADSGRLLENAVYIELRRRGWELSYFEGTGNATSSPSAMARSSPSK